MMHAPIFFAVAEQRPDAFEPTYEWQEVAQGQSVPSGLDVRLSLDGTHKTLARILPTWRLQAWCSCVRACGRAGGRWELGVALPAPYLPGAMRSACSDGPDAVWPLPACIAQIYTRGLGFVRHEVTRHSRCAAHCCPLLPTAGHCLCAAHLSIAPAQRT